MRTFVIGDIHGGYKGLVQVLERSGFDYDNDRLIQLGDVADGWSEVWECVEELLKIKNLIAIRGNHDEWFNSFLTNGNHPVHWLQGGYGTLTSYIRNSERKLFVNHEMGGYSSNLTNYDIKDSHLEFFRNQKAYFLEGGRLFVHGGFNRHLPLEEQEEFIFAWDRDFWLQALSHSNMKSESRDKYEFKIRGGIKEVFLGHTPTQHWGTDIPMNAGGQKVWNLDTGAAFKGKISIMNIDTKEYWQSDPLHELYSSERGRN